MLRGGLLAAVAVLVLPSADATYVELCPPADLPFPTAMPLRYSIGVIANQSDPAPQDWSAATNETLAVMFYMSVRVGMWGGVGLRAGGAGSGPLAMTGLDIITFNAAGDVADHAVASGWGLPSTTATLTELEEVGPDPGRNGYVLGRFYRLFNNSVDYTIQSGVQLNFASATGPASQTGSNTYRLLSHGTLERQSSYFTFELCPAPTPAPPTSSPPTLHPLTQAPPFPPVPVPVPTPSGSADNDSQTWTMTGSTAATTSTRSASEGSGPGPVIPTTNNPPTPSPATATPPTPAPDVSTAAADDDDGGIAWYLYVFVGMGLAVLILAFIVFWRRRGASTQPPIAKEAPPTTPSAPSPQGPDAAYAPPRTVSASPRAPSAAAVSSVRASPRSVPPRGRGRGEPAIPAGYASTRSAYGSPQQAPSHASPETHYTLGSPAAPFSPGLPLPEGYHSHYGSPELASQAAPFSAVPDAAALVVPSHYGSQYGSPGLGPASPLSMQSAYTPAGVQPSSLNGMLSKNGINGYRAASGRGRPHDLRDDEEVGWV